MLVARLLQDPGQWYALIGQNVASTMLSIVYDWHPDDPRTTSVVERIYQMAHRLAYAAIPGNYLVEMFPIMLHLPDWLAGWKRDGRAWFKKDSEMYIELLKGVQDKMVRFSMTWCIIMTLTHSRPRHQMPWIRVSPQNLFKVGPNMTSMIRRWRG